MTAISPPASNHRRRRSPLGRLATFALPAAAAAMALPASFAAPARAGALPAAASSAAPADAPAGSAPLTLTWSKVTTPVAPPPLSNASAVYDSDNHTVVLFGGRTATGTLSNDTWVWNGSTWQDYPGSQVQAPSPRQMASVAFDPQLHQLILFGGLGADGQPLGDTWAWNGASWYQQTDGLVAQSPGPREGAAMSNDARGHLLLFGGTGFAVPPVPPTTAPSTTTSTSTTAPSQGGQSNGPSDPTTTTGAGSGSAPAPTPAGPGDGGTGTTAAPTAAGTPPHTANLVSAAASTLGDTWLWTSSGWTPGPTAGPPARSGAAMALDTATGQMVLMGGNAAAPGSAARHALADTWAWNGTAWQQLRPSPNPAAREDAAMMGDALTGGLVLFGGLGSQGALGDTWLWSGTAWHAVRTAGEPAPRSGAAAAFDSLSHQLLLFGGIGSSGATLGDTEILTGQAPLVLGTGRATPPTASGSTGTTHRPSIPGRHAVVKPSTTTTAPTTGTSSTGAPNASSLAATTHRLHRGDLVTLTGTGFAPGATITITFHSTPTLVGQVVAGPRGDFSVTVAIPETAASGLHHFIATGHDGSGQTAELTTAVDVIGVPLGGRPTPLEVGVLVGLAILLPAVTWCGLAGAGWWRRRRPATT